MDTFGTIENYFTNSLKQSKIDGHLSISHRQEIIKLIAKRVWGKRFVKIWRRISLLMLTQKYFLNHLQKN